MAYDPSVMTRAAATQNAFARWFRGSQVTDDTGAPRVVYHGTRSPEDFEAFLVGDVRRKDGSLVIEGGNDPSAYLGPHFASSHEVASAFACGSAAEWDRKRRVSVGACGGRVIPVYLSICNPDVFEGDDDLREAIYELGRSSILEMEMREMFRFRRSGPMEQRSSSRTDRKEWIESGDGSFIGRAEAVAEALRRMREEGGRMGDGRPATEFVAQELGVTAAAAMRRAGYDGLRYINTIETDSIGVEWDWTWVPFFPSQIKSAISNTGAFGRRVPSIVRNPPKRKLGSRPAKP